MKATLSALRLNELLGGAFTRNFAATPKTPWQTTLRLMSHVLKSFNG